MFNKMYPPEVDESTPSSSSTSHTTCGGWSYTSGYVIPCARKILKLVNCIREERNVGCPLSTHKGLCRAAEQHAAKMSESIAPFSHDNALKRINDAGEFDGCGENLARLENYQLDAVPEAAVDGWTHSPGHFRNMIMPDFNVCGIGIATYFKHHAKSNILGCFSEEPAESVTFVTMLFGIEREASTDGKSKLLHNLMSTDATICTCGLLGVALGGTATGAMFGYAAGTMLHRAVGISPQGTGFCVKEFAKRELLGLGRLTCTNCCEHVGKYESDNQVYCEDCWLLNGPDGNEEADVFVVL